MEILPILRRAIRQVRRQRLYTGAVAATLALAVAAASASFAVVKRAFLDPLPYSQAQDLVSLLTVINGQTSAVSAPLLEDLRGSGAPIADYVPIDPEGVTYSDGQSSEQIVGAYTSPSFFTTLGVRLAAGRPWQEGDRHVAVVSWSFWTEKLGGGDDAVGRSININGTPHAVVGVLPQTFLAPYFTTASVWMPLDVQPLLAGSGRARRTLSIVARMAPGTSVERLNAHLAAFSTQMQQAHPQVHGRQSWTAAPLRDELVGTAGPALLGVGAAATLLLAIVLANIAGLSAARALGTRQQVAVRLALGATHRRIWLERLAESLVIAMAGAVIGVWLGDLLVTIIATHQAQFMPRLAPVAMDWAAAGAGMVIGLLAGGVASVLPAGAGGCSSMEALRSSRSSAGSQHASVVRSGLVVVQVALALVLLVGAGLLVRTMHHLSTTSLGFAPDGLTTFTVTMPAPRYETDASQIEYERAVIARLEAMPAVRAATASVGFPVVGSTRASLSIFGRPEVGRDEIMYMSMAPGFIQTTGMRLLEGRDLAPSDSDTAPPVVLINETMARHYWPNGGAVGTRVRIGPGTESPWITVIGIVADIRQHGPTQPVMPTSFGSTYQYSWPRRHFTVRSDQSSAALASDLRAVVRSIDPEVPMGVIQTVDDMVYNQTGRHRLVMLALTFFGVVATVLCVFGLYAVVALTSQMRRREYAIRMALGAARGNVRWMVVRQALMIGMGGVAVGLCVAAIGTRVLEGLLHGVRPLDTPTFAVAGVAILGMAALAASLPARAAGRVDPVESLKAD